MQMDADGHRCFNRETRETRERVLTQKTRGRGSQGFMLRTPARRARMASCLASVAPYLRMENILRRTTYGFGLQVACQYVRIGQICQFITLCTPTMPDEPLFRGSSA